jgi:hypothetical protein
MLKYKVNNKIYNLITTKLLQFNIIKKNTKIVMKTYFSKFF